VSRFEDAFEQYRRGRFAETRASSDRRHTTVREHMPSSHRRYADWTPERIRRQVGEIGRNNAAKDVLSGSNVMCIASLRIVPAEHGRIARIIEIGNPRIGYSPHCPGGARSNSSGGAFPGGDHLVLSALSRRSTVE
jgi:hypothetical protein